MMEVSCQSLGLDYIYSDSTVLGVPLSELYVDVMLCRLPVARYSQEFGK